MQYKMNSILINSIFNIETNLRPLEGAITAQLSYLCCIFA